MWWCSAVIAAVAMLPAARASDLAQTGYPAEDFTAWAVNRGESELFLSSAVDIHLERWSTETEKDRFARTLLNRGPRALLEMLGGAASVGVLRTPVTPVYDLEFAWQEPVEDGGRRIILIADQPMTVWNEAMRLKRIDDLFTVIEIRLNPDGEGEGKVAIGSNATVNRTLDLIELEDYDNAPVRLRDIRTKHTTTF
jgi:hypothetical protein